MKVTAQRQMSILEQDIYKPSLANIRTLKTWLQTKGQQKKMKTSPNRRVISPKVNATRHTTTSTTLPQLIRVPSSGSSKEKKKLRADELINPSGDGKYLKTVKPKLVTNNI